MPHAPKAKPKPKAKRPKRKRRRKRKTARIITPGFGDFRRPRRFAHQPKRGPASVLHKHSAAFMLGALARAHSVLGKPEFLKAAEKNLAFIQAKLWDTKTKTLEQSSLT